jgi:hypothetical protein
LVCVTAAAAMAGCSPKNSGQTEASAAAPAAGAPTPAASADAPPAASPADSASGNPLIGSWTLVSADNAPVCADSIQFTDTTYTTVSQGVTTSNPVLYHAYPGYVTVFVNGDLAHYLQYDLTSADVITNVTSNQYAVNNCPYKRA